jgi:hypothetical protein
MHRFLITVFFSAIVCLGLASPLWSGTDLTSANPGKGLVGGGETLRVLWTVSGYKRTNRATWTENQAKTMLSKPLDIDQTSIAFDRKRCDNVCFTRKEVKASKYLKKLCNVTPQWLGIDDGVMKVVRTSCKIPGFSEYMHLSDRRLVIYINGIFFFLEPNVTY